MQLDFNGFCGIEPAFIGDGIFGYCDYTFQEFEMLSAGQLPVKLFLLVIPNVDDTIKDPVFDNWKAALENVFGDVRWEGKLGTFGYKLKEPLRDPKGLIVHLTKKIEYALIEADYNYMTSHAR